MTRLSVNVNKIATLRNSRKKDHPNLLEKTLLIESFGAQGITVHPRPDERHITKQDTYNLAKHISVPYNIEGYPSPDYIHLINEISPAQCTLVPDPPEALTSNAGWRVDIHKLFLKQVISQIQKKGRQVSLFIDPIHLHHEKFFTCQDILETGADTIELYTESYADHFGTDEQEATLKIYSDIGKKAHESGLFINAGHDLNQKNLKAFHLALPFLNEVSIGHAIICDSLVDGLERTIKNYLDCLS